MSRGIGRTQRDLMEQLRALDAGAGILPGDSGGNMRRAALGLADRGLVRLQYLDIDGRRRQVIRLLGSRSVDRRV